MARRAVLGGGSLNPFGGGGVDFGAFNILNAGNEAYLAFVKVETAWNAGHATNDDYLTALGKYADAQDANSSDWVSVHARLEQAKYQVGRNILLSKIDARTASVADLVAYDKSKVEGLIPDSQEYQQRLDLYRQSQARLVSDEEKKKVDLYQAGKMTTTQLQAWYQGVIDGPLVDRNPDLTDSLKGRVTELVGRVQDEKDSKMLSDFNDGKVTTHDFLAYATAAKSRYAAGTQQAQEWDGRIHDAKDNASETALLYRYNLSQQYAQLAEFVKGNSGGSGGRTSTSTSHQTRVVLGTDGKWHSVTTTSTKTKAVKPSAAEVAAHAKLQIEIADAKRQMAAIAKKASSVGGFVQSANVLKFYSKKLGTLAKGSSEWYAVQGKIDSVNDRIHQEQVTAKEGIRITYPGSSSSGGGSTQVSGGGGGGGGGSGGSTAHVASGGAGGGGYSMTQFMRAIATQESGGRYNARNASTGAYGKYQILPSNWSSWAQKAGLPANAPQTPENQERVATAAFSRLAKSYHNDWSRVAAAWFAGVAGSADPNHWGPRTVRYVDAIMSHMGTTRAAVAGGGSRGGSSSPSLGSGSYSAAAGGGSAPSAVATTKPKYVPGTHQLTHPASTGSGPLAVITGVDVAGRRTQSEVVSVHNTGFPANLDGRAFEHFYSNYEHAFEAGAESFVDTSTGKAIAYFIGDDPAERIDRMRQLDDLRVSLFDTRAVAYQGTASELTAQNARNNAVQDVARHEYLIVDTAAKTASGSAKLNAKTNPLASGLRVLDTTSAAIKGNLAMAEAAYKRGDLTGAYALFQTAQELLDANGAKMQLLAGYAAATDAKLAAISRATGGIGVDEALGGKATSFNEDLDRLHAFDKELTGLFTGTPAATLTELKSHLQLDAQGNAQFDDPGDPRAQLRLSPDTYFLLKPNGDISVESRPPQYDGNTGKSTFSDGKTVTVKIKSGANVIDAQAAFTIAQVGSFIDPNDPSRLLPIMGKVVQQKIDGKWQSFYENPLAPGSKEGWSATPWVFQTGPNFKSTPDGKGGASYTFSGGQGYTYQFVFDAKSGTYQLSRSRPGGILNSEVVDEYVGSAGEQTFADQMTAAGFARSGGGSGFDSTSQPVFGFNSASEYDAWVKSFQPPAMANLGSASSGGRSLEDRDALDMSPAQVQARKLAQIGLAAVTGFQTQKGNEAAASSLTARAAAQAGMNAHAGAAAASSALENKARAEAAITQRAAIGSGVTGATAAVKAVMANRAALPTTPDPEWVATQRRQTSPTAAAKATVGPPKPKPVAPKPKPTAARKSTARRPLPKPVAPPPVKTAGSGLANRAL